MPLLDGRIALGGNDTVRLPGQGPVVAWLLDAEHARYEEIERGHGSWTGAPPVHLEDGSIGIVTASGASRDPCGDVWLAYRIIALDPGARSFGTEYGWRSGLWRQPGIALPPNAVALGADGAGRLVAASVECGSTERIVVVEQNAPGAWTDLTTLPQSPAGEVQPNAFIALGPRTVAVLGASLASFIDTRRGDVTNVALPVEYHPVRSAVAALDDGRLLLVTAGSGGGAHAIDPAARRVDAIDGLPDVGPHPSAVALGDGRALIHGAGATLVVDPTSGAYHHVDRPPVLHAAATLTRLADGSVLFVTSGDEPAVARFVPASP